MRRSIVDLPQPLGPTIETNSPGRADRSTSIEREHPALELLGRTVDDDRPLDARAGRRCSAAPRLRERPTVILHADLLPLASYRPTAGVQTIAANVCSVLGAAPRVSSRAVDGSAGRRRRGRAADDELGIEQHLGRLVAGSRSWSSSNSAARSPIS